MVGREPSSEQNPEGQILAKGPETVVPTKIVAVRRSIQGRGGKRGKMS